jgi:alpha-tubulin suppressor-like RCC1 family protein
MNTPSKIFRITYSIIAAVSITALICVCTKQPADMARNNPCDPGGINWHQPVVTVTKNDTIVSINDSIIVTAKGTVTDDRKVVKYVWAKNGTTYSDSTDSGSLKVVWPDSGRKVVRVKAIDNDGVPSLPDSCVVTVLLDPPVPNAGKDTTVSIKDTVRLHGSATDRFGYITSWAWDIGNMGIFVKTKSGDTTIVAPSSQNLNYQCVLRVTDDDGNVAKDTVKVIVLQDVPVPNAGNDTTVSINDTVRLHGSATDRFGYITSWAWDIGNTGTFVTKSKGDTTIVAPSSQNLNYLCILRVTDDDGNVAKDTVKIIVLQDPPVPNAGKDTTVSINDTVRLHGSATDRFGYITSWAWDIGNTGTFVTKSKGDTTIVAPSSENLNYLCVLRVTDDDGNVVKDTVKIIVLQDVPVANAGNDTGVWINDTVLLHGSATQQFGSIVKWEWKIGSGGWKTTGGSDTTVIMPSTEQTVICSLAVTDDDGNSGAAERKIVACQKVVRMDAGREYSLILKSDSTLWTCGYNYYGQLGDGTTNQRLTPVQVMSSVQSVAAGGYHSLILKGDGTLWVCGDNGSGQLGDGTTNQRLTPVPVMTSVQSMVAGYYHSLILKTDGTLWACGYNINGQLGDGTTTERHSPVLVMSSVQSMAAGGYHSLILKTDGTLWACGRNDYGQLGDGTTIERYTPVQVMSGVQSVAAGDSHSLIEQSDGSLWACGYNYYGQLGDGTRTARSTPVQVMSNVQIVDSKNFYSLILKNDNTLWGCGQNGNGQLGDGTTTDRWMPVQVMTSVQSMAAGAYYSLMLKKDNTLWSCGNNGNGQFGDGTTNDRYSPVRIIPPLQ